MNENETKAKYFAQYLGCEMSYHNTTGYILNTKRLNQIEVAGTNYSLLLKPLQSISDEDAILLGFKDSKEFLDYFAAYAPFVYQIDLLRQLGYATDYTTIVDGKVITYSVQDLINKGWIKLI